MNDLICTPHIIRKITSFCSTGKECYSFGLTCKNIFDEFQVMLRISSHMAYRIAFANRNMEYLYPIDAGWDEHRCFDIFSPPLNIPLSYSLDSKLFVRNVDEFESHFKEEDLFTQIILSVLGDINKKYGEVCMISGSYALLGLLKTKSFIDHSKKIDRLFHLKLKEKIDTMWKPNFNDHDIDIFLLGKDKKRICEEIILELHDRISDIQETIKIKSRVGCTDLYVLNRKDSFENLERYEKAVQFILKKNVVTAFDVLSFFDLDCCTIGYFPGLQKVVATARFIKSISTYTNTVDFQANMVSSRHKARITKYFFRLGIRTSIEVPHPMIFFHSFKKPFRTRKEYVSRDFVTWGDYLLDGDGKTYVVSSDFAIDQKRDDIPGIIASFNKRKNRHRGGQTDTSDVSSSCRVFHFAEIGNTLNFPHDTVKGIKINYYPRYDESIRRKKDPDYIKEEKLYSIDLLPSMIFGDDQNPKLPNNWEEEFQIGEADFSYYLRCFGIFEKDGVFGYSDKIFPRNVKALLCYDYKTKLFSPIFLKKYKCQCCGKINEKNMKFSKKNKMLRCSICQKAFYCSKECQKINWKMHRKDCKKE